MVAARNRRLIEDAVRRVCGWTLASVAARAIAQAVLSRQGTWAPETGAAHDIATLALIGALIMASLNTGLQILDEDACDARKLP